jgi:hypothetical protein
MRTIRTVPPPAPIGRFRPSATAPPPLSSVFDAMADFPAKLNPSSHIGLRGNPRPGRTAA